MVQPSQGVRHPAGADLDDAAPQAAVPLEHSVQHQGAQEPLGAMIDHGEIFGTDHLGATPGSAPVRAAVVHPRVGDGQWAAADVQDEGHLQIGQQGPDGLVQDVSGRTAAGRVGGDPHRSQAQGLGVLDLGDGGVDLVQGHDGHAEQARIGVAELRHRAIVRRSRRVADGEGLGFEDQPGAETGKHHLSLEPKQLQRRGALVAVEGAEGLVPLGAAGEVVAQSGQLGDHVRRVFPHVRVAGEFELPHARERRNLLTKRRICMTREKVRQFHEMAVGVKDGPGSSVAHTIHPPSGVKIGHIATSG